MTFRRERLRHAPNQTSARTHIQRWQTNFLHTRFELSHTAIEDSFEQSLRPHARRQTPEHALDLFAFMFPLLDWRENLF